MNTQQLKQKILDLAIKGQLVAQDSQDEPAAVLLERIRAEKQELIKAKKIKKDKNASYITRDTIPYQQYTEHFADGTTKDITDQIPFDIPQNWAWCRLKDLCQFKGGYAFKSKDYIEFSENQIIRIGNVKNDNLILSTQPTYVSDETVINLEEYKIKSNDLLFTMTGTKGKRDYFFTLLVPNHNNNLFLNQRVGLLRVLGCNINAKYLNLALKHKSVLDAIFQTETGNVNQGNIGSENTMQLFLPLPPLSEQQRIVAKVEELLALVATIETNKTDLATYIQQTKAKVLDMAVRGVLTQSSPQPSPKERGTKGEGAESDIHNEHYHDTPFPIPKHWQWKKLGEIAQSNIGLTYKPIDISDDGIPILRSNNIQKNKLDLDDLVRVNGKIAEKNFIKKGDILICSRNGSRRLLGKCTLINEISEPLAFGAFMTICRSEINSWIFQVLQTEYFQRYLDDSNSTAINQITQKMLINFPIPLPPLSEQKAIVERIESIFEVLEDIETKLAPSPKGE